MYKIGDIIKIEELEEVAKGISLKAVKVIATNGDKLAFEILEGKKPEILEDIKQDVILKLLENNLKIEKNCFQVVRSAIYRTNKTKIELIIDEEKSNFLEYQEQKAYINYINEEIGTEEKSKNFLIGEILEGLTERQKEIVLIYSKVNSFGKVAELLGVSKSTVSNTIYRLREKIDAKSYVLM